MTHKHAKTRKKLGQHTLYTSSRNIHHHTIISMVKESLYTKKTQTIQIMKHGHTINTQGHTNMIQDTTNQ